MWPEPSSSSWRRWIRCRLTLLIKTNWPGLCSAPARLMASRQWPQLFAACAKSEMQQQPQQTLLRRHLSRHTVRCHTKPGSVELRLKAPKRRWCQAAKSSWWSGHQARRTTLHCRLSRPRASLATSCTHRSLLRWCARGVTVVRLSNYEVALQCGQWRRRLKPR